MEGKILVVEDDDDLRELIIYNLRREGYKTMEAGSGESAIELLKRNPVDLVLLDIMIPNMNGLDVLKYIRNILMLTVPVIFVTVKADEVDIVLGLELGADDYITKPFSIKELLARVKAKLRTFVEKTESGIRKFKEFQFGDIRVDFKSLRIFKRGKEIYLRPKEFNLLKVLIESENIAFTREELLVYAWGEDTPSDEKTVDVTISTLRKKLEDDPTHPKFLITVRGKGYRFSRI